METVYFMVSVKDDIFSVFYSDNGLQAASVFPNRRKWTRCDYMTYRPYTVCASDTIVFGAVDYNRLSEHTRGGKYYYGYCASDMARRFFEGLILHVKDMHPRFWEKETNGDDVYRRLWFFSRPNTMKPDEMNSYAAMLNSLGVVIDEEDALAAWENEQKENGVFEDSGDQIRAEELLHRIAEGMLIIAKKNYPAEDNQTIKTDISKSFCKAFDDVSATPVFREKIDNWKYEKEELLKQISKDYWKLTLEEVADKTAEEVEKMVGDEIFAWGVSEIKFRWNIAGKVKAKVREWLNQPVLDEIAMSSLVNTRKAVEKAETMFRELPCLPENEKVRLNPEEIEGAYFTALAYFYCPKVPEYQGKLSRAEKIIHEEIDRYFRDHFYPGSRMNLLKNNDWSSPYHWSGRNSLKEYLVVCTKSDEISQKPVQNTYQRMLRELEKEKERLMRNFR